MFILTGLPSIRDILRDSHESSLRLFQEFDLGPLSKEETMEIINKGLNDVAIKTGNKILIEDKAHELIFIYSEGYPHFIQQVAFSAFELNKNGVISAVDVKEAAFMPGGAIELIGKRYYIKPFYKDISSGSQREVLSIMAEKWNDWVSREEIKKKFSGGTNKLDNNIHQLRKKGIIIPRSGFKGQYRLQWNSFAFWIKNHDKTKIRG